MINPPASLWLLPSPLAACASIVAFALLMSSAAVVNAQDAEPSSAPASPPAITGSSSSSSSSSPTGSPLPSPAHIATPSGTWWAISFDPLGTGAQVPRADSTLTVSFLADGRLEGTTACGGYFGGYFVEGSTISIGIRSAGTRSCGPKRDDEQLAFSQALQAATTWAATDTGLELFDADGQARVMLVPAPEDSGLSGTWVVRGHADRDSDLSPPLEGTELTLTFEDGEVLRGGSDCRDFEGSYVVEADRLFIGLIEIIPGAPCGQPERRQDQRFRRTLDRVVLWSRDGDILTLTDADGVSLVELERAAE